MHHHSHNQTPETLDQLRIGRCSTCGRAIHALAIYNATQEAIYTRAVQLEVLLRANCVTLAQLLICMELALRIASADMALDSWHCCPRPRYDEVPPAGTPVAALIFALKHGQVHCTSYARSARCLHLLQSLEQWIATGTIDASAVLHKVQISDHQLLHIVGSVHREAARRAVDMG